MINDFGQSTKVVKVEVKIRIIINSTDSDGIFHNCLFDTVHEGSVQIFVSVRTMLACCLMENLIPAFQFVSD